MKNILFVIVLLVLVPGVMYPISAFDITEIQNRYQKSQWWSGKNLSEGDYFVYEICNSESFTKSTLPGHCYTVSLEFVALLQTDTGNKWIVQVQIITIDDDKKYAIFQVDADTFDVQTDRTSIEYADSVHDTIFHMSKYAGNGKQEFLKVGQSWGDVSSYMTPDPQMTVRNKSLFSVQDVQIPVFDVGYVILEKTVFHISPDMPFPLSATAYDSNRIIPYTPKIFNYDLLLYGKTGTLDKMADIFDDGVLDAIRQDALEFELDNIIQDLSILQFAGENDDAIDKTVIVP